MRSAEVTIRLSRQYDDCFDRALTLTDERKCRCWFDRKAVVDDAVQVCLTPQGIIIRYRTAKGDVQESCTYASVLGVTEMHEGILLRLSNKRLLFLQAANDRKDTECLMEAVAILEANCKYIFKKSNLRIHKAGLPAQLLFRLRSGQGHYVGSGYGKGMLILLICAAIFVGTVFVSQPANNRKITEPETVSLTVNYVGCDPAYRRGNIRYIDLILDDHETLSVDGSCADADLVKALKNIPEGTKLHLLLHPKSDAVLQIRTGGEILLAFSDAQSRLWREAVAFAALGLMMYVISAGLAIGLVRKKR